MLITFDEQGGYLVVPQNSQRTKTYQFSELKGQQKGDMECLHQWKEGNSAKSQHYLKTVGSISSRILIKANDEVYASTREKVKQVEKEYKQSSMAQEIRLTQERSRSKTKAPGRRHIPKSVTSDIDKPKSKVVHPALSLKDRVVHALALKSYSKSSLSARLSREKSQDNDFDQLDAILQEVATLQNGGLYVLKKSLFAQINADSWPLYGDAEKRIVRCNIASARSRSPDVTKKRSSPPGREVERPPKHFLPETQGISLIDPTSSVLLTPSTVGSVEGHENVALVSDNTPSAKHLGKKKKKHKVKKSEGKNRQISDERGDSCNPKSMEVVSPLYLPEYESHRQITTPEERAELKELFNKHHKGYLKLFEKVNGVVSEFTRLTEQLENHEPDSPEYKDIHQQIRDKYALVQNVSCF
jgi:RNA polymerase II elongation factor ELL